MALPIQFNTDETPYVLQVVLRTARSQVAVNKSIQAISILADQAFPPRSLEVYWSESITHKFAQRKAGSLPPKLKKSPDRVAALMADAGDGVTCLTAFGFERVRVDDTQVVKRHFVCDGVGDHGPLADHISYIVYIVIRLDNVLKNDRNGWRAFVRRAVAAVAASGGCGCGVIDILPTTRPLFGDAFTNLGEPQAFLRAVMWSRWVASAARGEDFVPWPGQGVVLSPDAVVRAGGLARISAVVGQAVATIRSSIKEVPVEGVADGGAIVWLAPGYESAFPDDEFETVLDISHDVREDAAAIYFALQQLGVAL